MKKQIQDVISKEFKGLWGTDFSDNGIPVIKTNNMTYEGRIDYSDICIRNITSEEAEGNYLCNGDLIIEKSGGTKTHSVGYVNIFEGEDNKYVCNNFILPLRPNRDLVNPKYLFWQLHGMYESGKFSDCFNKTTGIQNLQKKTYYSKEINVPALDEQKKIASHLDAIQSAIDNKKQQLSALNELVKSKFVEMFGENPVESGKWKVEKLGDVANIKIGPFGSLLHKQDYITNGHCLINPSHIIKGKIVVDPELSVSDEKYMELESYQLQPDDIVLGRRGEMGRCAVVYEKGFLCGTGSMIIRPNGKLISYFLNHILSSDTTKSYLEENAIGVTMKNINEPLVKSICVPIIPIDLQNDFAAYVQKIDSAKSVIKTQLADLQELLDSKMDHYFS